MKKQHSVSTLLGRLEQRARKRNVSVGDMIKEFQGRSSAPILFTLAVLVTTVGGIPGIAPMLGVLIVLVAAQALFSKHLWVPKVLRDRSMSGAKARKSIKKAIPWVRKMESFCRPRLQIMAGPPWGSISELIIVFLGLSILILTLIPGGLILPGLAIAILSMARFHHDGVWMITGLLLTGGCVALSYHALFQ